MNAISNSSTDVVEDGAHGSDSDTNPDEAPEYYQPISAVDDDEVSSDDDHASGLHQRLTNGGYHTQSVEAENGIASLEINDDLEEEEEEEKNSEDEEEERMRLGSGSDSAVVRAFREDESRRNAPLTPENATRVMEAMRGVSFGGVAPDWVGRVPEAQWIDRLRRLRQPPHHNPSTIQN
ncbi:uncharacterized protein LOC121238983 [Juglans microcarpa x Juglans regia]|uniref:uncharacterized protein LOC121238983 n=1 Tax=Juglans microcarpa x Juglans regia TaxID=2249226 RepID=UPI001B7DEB53|nr:uncharacterized protein LOC121238983 [Juglans microcarpa x Juglans regia]